MDEQGDRRSCISDLVADRIVKLRQRQGMTRDELSAACRSKGYTWITSPVLANIETGRRLPDGSRRRAVTVEELIAFADVLNVDEAQLLAVMTCGRCGGFPPSGFTCQACHVPG